MRRVEVGTAALVAAFMLGTVPAVGGYSNFGNRESVDGRAIRRLPADSQNHVRASDVGPNDFTTVGIVTEVSGAAFMLSSEALEKGKSEAQNVESGQGVVSGDRLWVEPRGLVRLTDTDGGRLSIAGPASVEFVRRSRVRSFVRIVKGSIKFHAADGESMRFENPLVAGSVAGEGAVWASEDTVQVLGLAGDVKAWHPQLEQAAVLVTPGFFSESSASFHHLQPTRPVRVDDGHFEAFLSRFEEGRIAVPAGEPAAERTIASSEPGSEPADEEHIIRGTRDKSLLTATRDEAAMRRLTAHIAGGSIDDLPVEKPLVAPGPRFNAFGSRASAGRQPASDDRAGFTVTRKSAHPGKDGKKLIKQLEEQSDSE